MLSASVARLAHCRQWTLRKPTSWHPNIKLLFSKHTELSVLAKGLHAPFPHHSLNLNLHYSSIAVNVTMKSFKQIKSVQIKILLVNIDKNILQMLHYISACNLKHHTLMCFR